MKTAIISDIHGNNLALQAVLADAAAQGAERYVFAGDYVFDAPHPNETVQTIMALPKANTYAIAGNKEGYLDWLQNDKEINWDCRQMGSMFQSFDELTPETIAYLERLPQTMHVPMDKGSMYVTHSVEGLDYRARWNTSTSLFHNQMREAPFSYQDYARAFADMLAEADWVQLMQPIDAEVVVFGHNHLQGHGYCGGKLVINPGSCGVPMDGDNRAAYTILEENKDGLTVTERRVPYDVEELIRRTMAAPMYARGRVWCEICILNWRTGLDCIDEVFAEARRIANAKGEGGMFYTDETWAEAYEAFCRDYKPTDKKGYQHE